MNSTDLTKWIYVLRLKPGTKYYVGKTNDFIKRYQAHLAGTASAWTQEYPPVEPVLVVSGNDYDEDKYVKMFMAKYGIENVRGGAYTARILSPDTIKFIQAEIDSANDQCYICHRKGHFTSSCPDRTPAFVPPKEVPQPAEPPGASQLLNVQQPTYSSAQQPTYSSSQPAYSSTQQPIYQPDSITYGLSNLLSPSTDSEKNSDLLTSLCNPGPLAPLGKYCTRCGRQNHYSDSCFAKTNVAGQELTGIPPSRPPAPKGKFPYPGPTL